MIKDIQEKEDELDASVFTSMRNRKVKIQLCSGAFYSGNLVGIHLRDKRIIIGDLTIHYISDTGAGAYFHSKTKESRRFNMRSIKSIQVIK